jgi:hypothetical protein
MISTPTYSHYGIGKPLLEMSTVRKTGKRYIRGSLVTFLILVLLLASALTVPAVAL